MRRRLHYGVSRLQISLRSLSLKKASIYSPVSAIFVGMLMRSFQGENFLSGNSACRWYISPDDPLANNLVTSYSERFEPTVYIEGAAEPVRAAVPSNQIQHTTLAQLSAMSPYQFSPEGFNCTTVIKNLVPGHTWWFASCNRCGKKSLPHGDGYRCPSIVWLYWEEI